MFFLHTEPYLYASVQQVAQMYHLFLTKLKEKWATEHISYLRSPLRDMVVEEIWSERNILFFQMIYVLWQIYLRYFTSL